MTTKGSRRAAKRPADAAEGAPKGNRAGRRWTWRLVRNTVLWLLPAAALWAVLTPRYNWFLRSAGENLVRLTESPNVTRLDPRKGHYAVIARLDFP
ncbi:MAG TPA: hypothetical protein VLF66_20105, partial [Thermoanaerobaculia bacterium]|nr:hypothetical protein [Thermoanaerobaculia bacterium]